MSLFHSIIHSAAKMPKSASGRRAIAGAMLGGNAGAYEYGRYRGMSQNEAAVNAIAPGITTSSAIKAQKSRESNEQAQADARTEQQRINDAIAELHAAYGIGNTGEAAYNHGALEHQYDQYAHDYISANSDSAQQGFDANQRAERFRVAETGQSGGSVDAGNQYADLQGLLGAQTQIASTARSNVSAMRSQDQGEMLQGQNDILGGTSSDEAILNGLSAHYRQVSAARAAVPYDAAGQLASYGGSLVSQNAQANGFYQGGGYGGGYPSYGMPGDAAYNPYYSQSGRSPGLFGRGGAGSGGSIT